LPVALPTDIIIIGRIGIMSSTNFIKSQKMNNNIGERLKIVRNSLNMKTQSQFAEKLGINQTTLSKYENGTSDIPDETKVKISGYGINLHWLLTGEGTPFLKAGIGASAGLAPPGTKGIGAAGPFIHSQKVPVYSSADIEGNGKAFVVPLLNQKLSAGKGADLPETDEATALIPVPPHLAKYGKNLAALTVEGDSMYPTLDRGDLVVCDSCGWSGEGVYALRMSGEGFVKRLTKAPGKVVIISDNPKYPTREEPESSQDFEIIGRVHCAIKNIE
jgi:SOS-response transcriptional repressor LexA/DNA-binding XRE family transcriptional regulator